MRRGTAWWKVEVVLPVRSRGQKAQANAECGMRNAEWECGMVERRVCPPWWEPTSGDSFDFRLRSAERVMGARTIAREPQADSLGWAPWNWIWKGSMRSELTQSWRVW